MTRVLYVLLAAVAAAAAVLSFSTLRDLAATCGFDGRLAWLLPVVVDAGAAAGSLVWLTRPPSPARRFGRALALALLGGSVAGNALDHGLDAYVARPAWWVVVAVSAVPPAVLGAVVHLAVLTLRSARVGVPGHLEDDSGPGCDWSDATPAGDALGVDRATELIAAGAGRRRLARELDISEYEARRLIGGHRNGTAP